MIVLEHSQIATLSESSSQAYICVGVLAGRLIPNLHANNDENQRKLEFEEREHLVIPVRRCRYMGLILWFELTKAVVIQG